MTVDDAFYLDVSYLDLNKKLSFYLNFFFLFPLPSWGSPSFFQCVCFVLILRQDGRAGEVRTVSRLDATLSSELKTCLSRPNPFLRSTQPLCSQRKRRTWLFIVIIILFVMIIIMYNVKFPLSLSLSLFFFFPHWELVFVTLRNCFWWTKRPVPVYLAWPPRRDTAEHLWLGSTSHTCTKKHNHSPHITHL